MRCYDEWVKARPIGLNATCGACDDHRRANLRYFEIGARRNAPGGRWAILCFNCVGLAEKLEPPPRSLEGLKMRLTRDRRWGDRRAAALGRPSYRDPIIDRRASDRRQGLRELYDATDLASELIELEAEFEAIFDDPLLPRDEVTGIHLRPPG
jgi:hypothetical protein